MHIYFIVNKTFYKKKSINKPNLLKTLVEWFQAVTIKACTSRGVFRGGHCAMPPPLGQGSKQKSEKYTLKSRNQNIIKHVCGRGLRYLEF